MQLAYHPDPFSPKLVKSEVLSVSQEQKQYIRWVLDKSSSDSRFADKAYDAIEKILTGGSVKVPLVSSLTPNSAEIGDPSFTIHIHGKNFTNQSKIIFNGYEEPTTYVSETELTTGVNMDVWAAPAVLPVGVMSADGMLSNMQNFSFTDGTIQTQSLTDKLQHALKSPVQKAGPIVPPSHPTPPSSPTPPVGYNPPTHLLNPTDKREEDKK